MHRHAFLRILTTLGHDEYFQTRVDATGKMSEAHGFPGMLGSIDCMH